MSTRSIISYFNGSFYSSIYCHWDGYPEHNGLILKKYYKDENKIKKLIELGNLSCLREELGEEHDTKDLSKGNFCIFYHRDLGEELYPPILCKNFEELKSVGKLYNADYIYVYNGTEWKFYYRNLQEILY